MGFGEKEWREHAALIGAVMLAWNSNVHQLLRIFTHLTGVEGELAEAIFFSSQSDSAQRHLVKRIGETVDLHESDRAALNRLLKRLETVSSGRNLATHVIFGLSAFDQETGSWGPKVVPALSSRQNRKLKGDFTTQFEEARIELTEIFDDLGKWLIHTPFPPRSFPGPPLPQAAAAAIVRHALESDIRATLGGGSAERFWS